MRIRPLLAAGFLVLTPLSCDRPDDLAGVGEARFVSAMAELQRLERDLTLDSAARTTARRKMLQERDLTPEQLEAAARSLADDPSRAQVIWAAIDSVSRLDPDSVAAAAAAAGSARDTTTADPPPLQP